MERGSLTTYRDLDNRSVYIRALAFDAAIGTEIARSVPQSELDEAMAWAAQLGIRAGDAGSRGNYKRPRRKRRPPIVIAPTPEEIAAIAWAARSNEKS